MPPSMTLQKLAPRFSSRTTHWSPRVSARTTRSGKAAGGAALAGEAGRENRNALVPRRARARVMMILFFKSISSRCGRDSGASPGEGGAGDAYLHAEGEAGGNGRRL